jgi:hypothetical protein
MAAVFPVPAHPKVSPAPSAPSVLMKLRRLAPRLDGFELLIINNVMKSLGSLPGVLGLFALADRFVLKEFNRRRQAIGEIAGWGETSGAQLFNRRQRMFHVPRPLRRVIDF